ncbi:hypothetical protein [Aquimarina macrocephali]|uniref:hypothetical protein n=1 Tax=Aquimarina macrocephali TaxID=666563 RepID=UPI003F6655F7
MKTKPLEYELSESALESVNNATDQKAVFDLSKKKNVKKGNTLVMINQETSKVSYIVPIFHKNKFYGGKIPKPSSLFIGQAYEFEKRVTEILNHFPKCVEMVLQQSPESDSKISLVKDETYHTFIMYKVSTITALISAVECFINELIPESFTIENKKKEIVGKEVIERTWNIKSKLKTIIPKIKTLKNPEEYDINVNRLLELNKIRNEFTHMKTKVKGNNMDPFIDYFELLINLNLKEKIDQTESLMDIMR